MNRLAEETSPYLRQHRDNPVDWYAWGPEAFAEARRRDRPILLSVGYSSCHWCHVMAHESFEDPATAAVMNEGFVNVKVDREERPDVDAIYMEAVQTMTGRGGWPMTVFLTPDGRPFFGGTYYPKVRRGQMASFVELLEAIDDAWVNRRSALMDQAGELTAALGRLDQLSAASDLPSRELLGEAAGRLVGAHDTRWGGFGPAPKFPHAMGIDFLLRWHVATRSSAALVAATDSLDAMAAGGIYDHLAGGFARYSTDERWLVPHFEKMLYDNALLTRAYLHAWQVTGEARHLQVLSETIGYVLADLTHPGGGFYSAEDADSEGLEGKFYVWTAAEVRAIGGEACVDWYGVTEEGNFDDIPAPDGGWNILSRLVQRGSLARPPEVEAGRVRLLAARSLRVRPGLDDKVLTEWNALMLSALAEAAFATGRADWLAAAVANGEFLLGALRRADGRWLRSWQADGGARHLAYAQDHAALVDAFVRLAEATGSQRWLAAASETADALLTLFWDDERGGLFTTGSDAETLITRPKDVMDNATPSATSLAAVGLSRLAVLTGDARYAERADALLRLVGGLAVRQPQAFGMALCALDTATSPPVEVVIPGAAPSPGEDRNGADRSDPAELVDALRGRWLPNAVLAWGEPGAGPLWENRSEGLAYVCRGYACGLPATTPTALAAQLDSLA